MTIQEYQDLTGLTVASSNIALVTAQINRTRRILERLLGYTLNSADRLDNEYTETGKTQSDCPCPEDVDLSNLQAPDAVVYGYRLFTYHKQDRFLAIDPATAVAKVKLVKDGVTYRTLDADDYRLQWKNGIVKFLEQTECWCLCNNCECNNVQLAVDANWIDTDDYEDLQLIWADMVTYYADPKFDIKSETLGSHSYTRFDTPAPETDSVSVAILRKYVGPNGSLYKTITL